MSTVISKPSSLSATDLATGPSAPPILYQHSLPLASNVSCIVSGLLRRNSHWPCPRSSCFPPSFEIEWLDHSEVTPHPRRLELLRFRSHTQNVVRSDSKTLPSSNPLTSSLTHREFREKRRCSCHRSNGRDINGVEQLSRFANTRA